MCRTLLSPKARIFVALTLFVLARLANAQSRIEMVEAMGLDTAKYGRVTAHFAVEDKDRAEQLALLADGAASYLQRELDIGFEFSVAALAPENWLSEFPRIPYAIPWASIPDKLIFMPSSLEEGLLVRGPSRLADRRRADFILLHEYGHILSKSYFRRTSESDYLPVPWLDELLANYFAYAYIQFSDANWAMAAEKEWQGEVESFAPTVLSLDWSYMNELRGDVVAREYGWYQFNLNLWAAELYKAHGLDLLRNLKVNLSWESSDKWTAEDLLPQLEDSASGFVDWVDQLGGI